MDSSIVNSTAMKGKQAAGHWQKNQAAAEMIDFIVNKTEQS